MASYTVFDGGQVERGSAESVLERIRQRAATDNAEIAKMTTEQYARALIEDAPYFLEVQLLDALRNEQFESDFDRALTYLAQMPTSGVRILSVNGHQAKVS